MLFKKDELEKNINILSAVYDKKALLEYLKCVRIKRTTTDEAIISISNLTIDAFCKIKVRGNEDFDYSIDMELFKNAVKTINADDIVIETDKEKKSMLILGGKAKSKTPMYSGDQPKITVEDNPDSYKIDLEEFKIALSKVINYCSNDEGKPTLTGVKASFSKDDIVLVATDGYRAVRYTIPSINTPLTNREVVFSKEFCRLIEKIDLKIATMDIGNNNVIIKGKNIEIGARLLESNSYPKIEEICKNTTIDNKVTLKKSEIKSAINLIRIVPMEYRSKGLVVIEVKDKNVSIRSAIKESTSDASMNLDGEGEEDIIKAVKDDYFIDLINLIDKEEIEIFLNSGNNAIKLETDNIQAILLPVRTNS